MEQGDGSKPPVDELDEMVRQRTAATQRIVESTARKKLVVAGPGTGKTFTFQEVLRVAGGKGLALTFIRNLVDDLKEALGEQADVFTLHGFCKHLLHRHAVEGLQEEWDYYPLLLELLTEDLQILGRVGISRSDVDSALHDLDDSEGLVPDCLALGNYYNAVSHTDLVYRVLRHFEHYDDKIPVYPLVVVDEYQDFSKLETSFIALLATKSPVLIAGDDDQALYGFKNASARYIRELAEDETYESFELPYCSRCTSVIVGAVSDVISAGLANGNLGERLKKSFECYLPDKRADSEAHPKIIYANCSVQTKKASYVGRYITTMIADIPAEDIGKAKAEGYPTVLVIGDKPFMPFAYEVIKAAYPQTQMKKSVDQLIGLLDGYRRLALNEESRLGWRIVIHCDPPKRMASIVKGTLEEQVEFPLNLPSDYHDRHLKVARLVRQLREDGALTHDAERMLVNAVDLPIGQIKAELAIVEADDDGDEVIEAAEGDKSAEDAPTIVCTSRLGAKGLSAAHVFVIGVNNGYFPQDPDAITDEEVCKLLVALSRTRQECHIVSCGRFATEWLSESKFADWLRPHLAPVKIDKEYFAS